MLYETLVNCDKQRLSFENLVSLAGLDEGKGDVHHKYYYYHSLLSLCEVFKLSLRLMVTRLVFYRASIARLRY